MQKRTMSGGPILIVPACEKGQGGGHLVRSMFLLRQLRERGREAYLWISDALKENALRRFGELLDASFVISRRDELFESKWDFVVFDNFRTSIEDFEFWAGLPFPLIGIDEGGPCRNCFDFLIDLLPNLQKAEPNLSAPRLLPLPKNRRPELSRTCFDIAHPLRILISFGAEDGAGLGILTARALAAQKTLEQEITLVAPNSEKTDASSLSGVNVVKPLTDLKERLAEYDLFITHYGLGAFEAVYARVPALLISPTPYHERLAKKAGFLTLKYRDLNLTQRRGGAERILNFKNNTIARRYGLEEEQKEDFASYINRLAPASPRKCPACGEKAGGKALTRFPDETYRRCPRCGILYLSRLNAPSIEYDNDYFFDAYKKQYGKTYLEDFPALKEMARKRLEHIKMFLSYPEKHLTDARTILDIGCAYGPFLAAAAEAGFVPTGIEPIEDAARYVKEKLGFTCWQGFFSDALPKELRERSNNEAGSFDAITLWYVIEHFRETGAVLREVHRLLKDGGVLALSTPSCSGISGRKSIRVFLKNSPGDHFTVWSPRVCKRIFAQYGFTLRKIVVTGHHPERFPLLGRFARQGKKGALYRLLLFISRLFALGDTFEAYGVKKKN